MPDPKKIEIELKASGGDAAAGEIAKPIEPIDAAKVAAAELADVMREMADEMLQGGASSAEVSAALEPLQAQLNAITDAVVERTEAEAANLAMAREMADARQAESAAAERAAAAARDAAEIAQAQAEAYAEEAAELKKLEEAYDAAQVAHAKLAEEEATKRIKEETDASKKQTDALDKLGRSVRNLIPGYGSLMSKVENLKGAWNAASASGVGMGQKLLALAGGPVAILVAGIAGLIAIFVSWRKEVAAVESAVDDLTTSTGKHIDELSEIAAEYSKAKTATSDLTGELGELSAAQDLANEKWLTAAERLEAIKVAQDNLAKAKIDAQVASGEIGSDEGRARKAEIDMTAAERKLALEKEIAAAAKESADAEARRAADAERIARAELEASRARVAEAAEIGQRAQADGATKSGRAGAIAALDFTDRRSADKAIDLAGGEEAVRSMIAEMDGVRGTIARTLLAMGARVKDVIGPLEGAAIAAMIAAEAEAETAGAKEATDKAVGAAQQIAAEKEQQLAATKRAREAAEKEAAAAEKRVSDVAFEEELAAGYERPARQAEIDSARAREAAKKASEDEARRKQIDNQVNDDAAGLAKEFSSRLDTARPGSEKTEVYQALQQAIQMLSDGTDAEELAAIRSLISIAEANSQLAQQTKSELAGYQARISALESQSRNNR